VSKDPKDTSRSASSGALLAVVGGAGLTGAAGVVLAAIAAHRIDSPSLQTAAMMLMVHAAAALALAAFADRSESGGRWLITAGLMLSAVVLFSGAVTYQAVRGHHLFAYSAPIGGTLLIVSWCAVAVLAVLEALDRR
jgi:uncharacterized membrane protein YgdD (TMEM256/DUF423 family)